MHHDKLMPERIFFWTKGLFGSIMSHIERMGFHVTFCCQYRLRPTFFRNYV